MDESRWEGGTRDEVAESCLNYSTTCVNRLRNSMAGALQEDLVPATLIEMAYMVVMTK